MPKYIDADKLMAEAKRLSGPMTGDGWDNFGVFSLIERQPEVDALFVVTIECTECRKCVPYLNYCGYCGKKIKRITNTAHSIPQMEYLCNWREKCGECEDG